MILSLFFFETPDQKQSSKSNSNTFHVTHDDGSSGVLNHVTCLLKNSSPYDIITCIILNLNKVQSLDIDQKLFFKL